MTGSRPLSRRFVGAAAGLGVSAVVTTLLTTVSSLIVARAGGPQDYATFVTSNMVLFVTSVVGVVGLPLVLAKQAGRDEESGNLSAFFQKTSSAIWLAMIVGLTIGILMAAVLEHFERLVGLTFGPGFAYFLPLAISLAIASDCGQGIYSGLLRPWPVISIAASGPASMFLYLMVWRSGYGLPLWGAVATSYSVSGIVAIVLLTREKFIQMRFQPGQLKGLKSDLLPAASYTYFTTFSTWTDRGVVGLLLGPTSMGWYTAAAVIVQVALRLPTHIAYLLVPTSARLDESVEGHTLLRSKSIEGFAVFALAAALIVMLAPTEIMTLMFGPGFARGADALVILGPSLLAAAITVPFLSMLTGTSRNSAIMYLLLFTTVPRLLLIVLFTVWWGFVGTALATVSSDALLALVCVLAGRKLRRPVPLNALRNPLLGALLALGIGLALRNLGMAPLVSASLAAIIMVPLFIDVARKSGLLDRKEPQG